LRLLLRQFALAGFGAGQLLFLNEIGSGSSDESCGENRGGGFLR